jgi:hypothetical protein
MIDLEGCIITKVIDKLSSEESTTGSITINYFAGSGHSNTVVLGNNIQEQKTEI